MVYINRKIEKIIQQAVQRGKSILLLGPRQTGKTTLITHQLQPDINYTFAKPEVRLRYEKDLGLLERELSAYKNKSKKSPLVFIDEVQKVPIIMDAIQDLIDRKIAQFILSGSSARKLKHGSEINLLPGRVIALTLDPLNLAELPEPIPSLEELLIYGSLPGIIEQDLRELELMSYVITYLEEEIRAEAVVRNVGSFARFLELAASESGNIMNFSKLSQEIGVAASTIADYYQILEDCLIINRIDPIINSISHRRLIKAPKYLFFDLGIRRACTGEGVKLSVRALGLLFEQFVGLELIRLIHQTYKNMKLRYWRDAAGAEVDYVLDVEKEFIPIEVKWSTAPTIKDIRHLQKFLREYSNAHMGYVVCRTPQSFMLADNITAIPWQEIYATFRAGI